MKTFTKHSDGPMSELFISMDGMKNSSAVFLQGVQVLNTGKSSRINFTLQLGTLRLSTSTIHPFLYPIV